ncbi:HTH domain-containing protein [Oceanicoccus sp. KOV_DT_Chl]|uniref:HTH domain-containing protein n=1 Tax=Oceanicoccus sp. KOV_DT_Chl TaxID=1904639 RepID=UPI00135A1B11|nr:HTH domain-containing protein [Oceanicoccus sp. KOV_DT_Chl]
MAEEFSAQLQKDPQGFQFSSQLDFFSEPVTLSRSLGGVSEKRVAFHTADLSLDERELVEKGLLDGSFDIVFATPTLAAGVNFPFQTVLFDSFERPWVPNNRWLPKDEFQNMSGRAGRLGMHSKGYSVLLPSNRAQQIQANNLIGNEKVDVSSKLIEKSLRKLVLNIFSSRVANTRKSIADFFENTFWWYEQSEKNPEKLRVLPGKIDESIQWLLDQGFIQFEQDYYFATDLGVATARVGLLPPTVREVVDVVSNNIQVFSGGVENWVIGLIHAICASSDFAEGGQRFLPFARGNRPEAKATRFLRGNNLFLNINASNMPDKVQNAAYAISLWIEGVPERQLSHELPAITYGYMQRLSDDVAWVLSGLQTVLSLPSLNIPEKFLTELSLVVERIKFGVPVDLVDLVKIARSERVPGFGRHRAMVLKAEGLHDPNSLHSIDVNKLNSVLENPDRVAALLNAIANYLDKPLKRWEREHSQRAEVVGIDKQLITDSYELIGDDYETPIETLLNLVQGWVVEKIDDLKRQGVPDFQICCDGRTTLVECKTKLKEGLLFLKMTHLLF